MNWKELKNMTSAEWVQNLILYAIGVGIMPLGVVLTVNAHLGAGGYDALNFALGDKLHINTSFAIYGTAFLVLFVVALHERGVKIGTAKIGLDAVCVILALLLGGEIGVGTIICTFGLGPIIDLFHREINKVLNN